MSSSRRHCDDYTANRCHAIHFAAPMLTTVVESSIDVLMVTEPLPVACDDYTANLCVTGSIGRQLASPFLLRNARRVHTGGMSCCAWGASVIMGIRNGLSCLDTGIRVGQEFFNFLADARSRLAVCRLKRKLYRE